MVSAVPEQPLLLLPLPKAEGAGGAGAGAHPSRLLAGLRFDLLAKSIPNPEIEDFYLSLFFSFFFFYQ